MNYVEIEGCAHRCTQCAHCYKGKCMMYKHNNQTWDEYLKDIEPKTVSRNKPGNENRNKPRITKI